MNAMAADLPWKNETSRFQEKFGERGESFIRETFDQPAQLAADLKKYRKGGMRTEAVLVFQDNRLLFEKYDREMTSDTLHIGWSMSKSVMSLLYGVALKEKRVALSDSICKYSEPPSKSLCKIKIADVLQWSTGLDWLEDYEKASNPLYSSVLNLLYGEGHKDMGRFILGHKLVHEPGSFWRYSSGDSILASYLLKKIWQTENVQAIFKEKVFGPIGISKSFFETDPTSTIGGASYLQVTPYDLAKIGYFVMNDGKWGEQQILEPDFMAWAKKPSSAFIANPAGDFFGGAQWWSNDAVKAHQPKASLPELPPDTFFAMGHWGQYLIVIPSKKVIAIRLGDCRDGQATIQKFSASVAKLLELK